MGFGNYKQTRFVIPEQLPLQPNGEYRGVATIAGTSEEMLENFNTQKEELFLVLSFREFKPLVCKNPVLDSLQKVFPGCEPSDIVGQQIMLYGLRGRTGSNDWHVVRIDESETMRMQTPQSVPEPMRNRGSRVATPPPAQEPASMSGEPGDRNPPPPSDRDAEFFGNEEAPF